MENILYLVHCTNNYQEDWKSLKPSNVDDFEDQFPGVYLSLITKENIDNIDLFPGKYILIFSKRLLEQQNYHINLRDHNGYISEANTYFPWNINKAVTIIGERSKITANIGNEVVFHDEIPMTYLCAVIINNITFIEPNKLLPHNSLNNYIEPDMTKTPFYCYPLEKNYTGRDPLPSSSRDFFVKMANTCGVDPNLPTNEIITQIKTKIPLLYNTRTSQKISSLKTSSGRSKSRRRRIKKKDMTKK